MEVSQLRNNNLLMFAIFSKIIFLIVPIFFFSCAGSKGNIHFDKLNYSASLSPYLLDSSGKILSEEIGLKRIEGFTVKHRFWGVFYGHIPLNGEEALISEINQSVENANGDGIINMTIIARDCMFNNFFILNIFPIFPGCTTIFIHGDIVRLQ